MPLSYGSNKQISAAIKSGTVTVIRTEIRTPVHETAGSRSDGIAVNDKNGVAPGEGDYILTEGTLSWDALDAMGKEDNTQNSHRSFYVDFMDDNALRYTCRMTFQEAFDAGLSSSDFNAAYSALKTIVYSDTVRTGAGLPTGGTLS